MDATGPSHHIQYRLYQARTLPAVGTPAASYSPRGIPDTQCTTYMMVVLTGWPRYR